MSIFLGIQENGKLKLHHSLAAISSILHHVTGFYTSVTSTLDKNGENVSELEHLITQVIFKVNQVYEKFL